MGYGSTYAVHYIETKLPPDIRSAELIRLRVPFDSDGYVYELKMDGFRALAYVSGDDVHLVSRRANTYKSFARPFRHS